MSIPSPKGLTFAPAGCIIKLGKGEEPEAQNKIEGDLNMKSIINGKRYDTGNAVLIGEYAYGTASGFEGWEAALYRTPRGKQYFIAGSGGAMTRYSQSSGQNSWGGGSRIDPLTPEDALDWAETYLSPEEIETEFSSTIEDA